MFEAVLTLCLDLAAGPCRDVLLPGREATSRAACEAALAAAPPAPGRHAPARARGRPACRPVGPALAVTEVAPGLFVHRGAVAEPDRDNLGDVANLAFVIGGDSVAVIDAGGSRPVAEALWRAIRARTALPVGHLILTHMHPDHVFGAALFAEAGATVIGHPGLARALADREENYRESFARLVGEEAMLGTALPPLAAAPERLDLGGRTLDLRAWPGAHTGTDLSVLDGQSGTLLAGDLVFDEHAPALDGTLRGWQRALQEMTAIAARQVVPGHGAAVLPWPEGAAPLERYLDTLARDVRAAIDRGARLAETAESAAAAEAGHWALFEAYNARNATVAFTELEWE
ncbi:quinoprotein relay system zinc metallohydrolase 2 [Roseivivax sp. CAU 1761]